MRRLDDFTKQKNRQIGIQYFDLYICTRENLLVQIFWPRILKFSLAFSVNAGLISDPEIPTWNLDIKSSYLRINLENKFAKFMIPIALFKKFLSLTYLVYCEC